MSHSSANGEPVANGPPLRCLLADDHPALVVAVSDFLAENGFIVVGPASNGEQAVEFAESEQPQLAVVDYRMPGLDGRELLTRLQAAVPGIKVLVYTAEASAAIVHEALARGAAGIVLKDAPLADLVRALHTVEAGRTYVDPALATAAMGAAATAPTLTAREREVLSLLSSGQSHEEIGGVLGIGTETVRTHLRKACDKLGASTRTQAVATALRHGFID